MTAQTPELLELSDDDARKIWCAVVQKAVEDYRRGPKSRGDFLKQYQEAREWLLSKDEEFPSFRRLCAELGMDPDLVLERLG